MRHEYACHSDAGSQDDDTPDAKSTMLPAAGNHAPPPAVDLAQRSVALRCLSGACENGQLLVDIFVNYDCDLEGANLFERLILALVRTAQAAPSSADSPAAAASFVCMSMQTAQPLIWLTRRATSSCVEDGSAELWMILPAVISCFITLPAVSLAK